jgi:hypothetical protein
MRNIYINVKTFKVKSLGKWFGYFLLFNWSLRWFLVVPPKDVFSLHDCFHHMWMEGVLKRIPLLINALLLKFQTNKVKKEFVLIKMRIYNWEHVFCLVALLLFFHFLIWSDSLSKHLSKLSNIVTLLKIRYSITFDMCTSFHVGFV